MQTFNGHKQCAFCGANNENGAVGYAGERVCPECGRGGDGSGDAAKMFYKQAAPDPEWLSDIAVGNSTENKRNCR